MTDDEFDEFCEVMRALIVQLEERIIALERQESVVHILPSDSYYWEHG